MSQKTDESIESVADSITLSRFDGRGLIRVLLWGAAAAAAVTLVVTTATGNVGAARFKQAVASIVEPPKAAAPQPAVTPQQLAKVEDETHALLKAVRDLSVERDQLKTRLASIEQSLTDITGAIKRQSAQAVKAEPPKPAIAAPAAPETTASIAPPPEPAPPEPPQVAPAPAAAAPVPLPPARLAHAASPSPHDTAMRQIGIDVAGASSVDELRARWSSIKANVGPDIAGLRPSYVVKRRPNGVAEYRLVLAPLPNTSAALRLCAKLNAAKVFCRAGYFNGEQMAEQ